MIETNKFNIKTIKAEANYGKFELSPLVGGFGHTLGNALRRAFQNLQILFLKCSFSIFHLSLETKSIFIKY
jgi:DNA-directed RNA polymerase subunit L